MSTSTVLIWWKYGLSNITEFTFEWNFGALIFFLSIYFFVSLLLKWYVDLRIWTFLYCYCIVRNVSVSSVSTMLSRTSELVQYSKSCIIVIPVSKHFTRFIVLNNIFFSKSFWCSTFQVNCLVRQFQTQCVIGMSLISTLNVNWDVLLSDSIFLPHSQLNGTDTRFFKLSCLGIFFVCFIYSRFYSSSFQYFLCLLNRIIGKSALLKLFCIYLYILHLIKVKNILCRNILENFHVTNHNWHVYWYILQFNHANVKKTVVHLRCL